MSDSNMSKKQLFLMALVLSLGLSYLYATDAKNAIRRFTARWKAVSTTGACPDHFFTPPPADRAWTHVAGTVDSHIYSAYMDDETGQRVRVIGLRKQGDTERLLCHLWYDAQDGQMHATMGEAKIFTVPDHHNKEYASTFFYCNVSRDHQGELPVAVSIVPRFKKCYRLSQNTIRIRHLGPMTTNFTLCVTPLRRNYSNAHQLVEAVEFNRILGAQKIIFFNSTCTSTVSRIVHYYKNLGVADVYEWKLPVTDPQVHNFAQPAALNECMLQSRNRTKYLVNQDLDEYIVPRKEVGDTWDDLMEMKTKLLPGKTVWIIRNVYVRIEWMKPWDQFPYNDKAKKYNSMILQNILREEEFLEHRMHSKYFVNPLKVVHIGIHTVNTRKADLDVMLTDEAVMYHYRNRGYPRDKKVKVEDVSVIQRFGKRLVTNLEKAWADIEEALGITPENAKIR